MKMQRYFLSLLLLLVAFSIQANNIQVSNVTLLQQDINAKTARVQFNLSWENSWRTSSAPNNWDAAWVFVKFQVGATDPSFTGANSSGTTITVNSTANLRVGMPVRVSSGTGLFAANTVISSITSATQFVVSATPTTQLSNASITCTRIWEHARLHNTDHTAATGSTIDAGLQTPASTFNETTNPAVGVFVYRSSNGIGTNTFNNMQLRWNYGSNGISDATIVKVRVFAVEMVYVPQGSFFVGSGGTEDGSFTNGSWTSGSTIPLEISSENALRIEQSNGRLWGTSVSGNNTIGAAATLSSSFPKGFQAFYCMKYEITQGQFRDFLNTLTRSQQDRSTATSLADGITNVTNRYVLSNQSTLTHRNGIRCDATIDANSPINFYCDLFGDGIPNQSNDGEWIACNYLTNSDGAAYADWAALRPMTELEFEKACRGNQTPVNNEYPWGVNSIISSSTTYSISNSGQFNESTTNASESSGNALYSRINNNTVGPLRVGIFATQNSTRITSGASYYGIMELGGNLWEQVISVGIQGGRSFTGVHGDGSLSTSVSGWPILSTIGYGFRGGGWENSNSVLRISSRLRASDNVNHNKALSYPNGFRAVRTAPN